MQSEKKRGLAPYHYVEIDNSQANLFGKPQQKQSILLLYLCPAEAEKETPVAPVAPVAPVNGNPAASLSGATKPPKRDDKEETEKPEAPKPCAPKDTILDALNISDYGGLPKEVTTSIEIAKKCAHGIDCFFMLVSSSKADLNIIIPEKSYTQIVLLNDGFDFAKIKEFSKSRWGSELQLDGHVFYAKQDSIANLTTLATGLNNPHLTIIPLESVEDSPALWATGFASVVASNSHTPSMPFQTLEVPGLQRQFVKEGEKPTPVKSYRLAERNRLLESGVATWKTQGNSVFIDRIVTTYTKDNSGVDDPSYRDLTTLQILSFLRFDLVQLLLREYPRHMLALDDYPYPGPVVTPRMLKMRIVARFEDWRYWCLVQDPLNSFSKTLQVDASLNQACKVNIRFFPYLMNQYIETDVNMSFSI